MGGKSFRMRGNDRSIRRQTFLEGGILPFAMAAAVALPTLSRAESFCLGPDLSPVAKVITIAGEAAPGKPSWIQLRINFDALLPEPAFGWRDYAYHAEEPVALPPNGKVEIGSAPLRKDHFESGGGKFNSNIGYQF